MSVIIIYILSLYAVLIACNDIQKPHIVVIVGDDMGWDDISLHGSDSILTPNIDMIGYQGVIIPNYYTDCQGTASRSAMFTGKYPMRMGTQGPSIGAAEDRGIPISERILPSYLKDLGYVSHFIGKWLLGKSRKCYLPTNRGFDSSYAFYSDIDYYTYNHIETFNETEYSGLDLFHDMNPVLDQSGHITDILTDRAVDTILDHDVSFPLYLHVSHAAAHIGGGHASLQVPGADIKANNHLAHSARRLYAGLVSGIDRSVGKMIEALGEKGILNNTLLIFVCDNGAQSIGVARNYGSNLPLRGTKGTPWEGAVRSTAVMWHAGIDPKVWLGLFHVTDWIQTLLVAAGGETIPNIDGVSHWDSIVYNEKPKRTDAIIAVDDLNEWGAFRDGDFKIIVGTVPETCGYYGQELDKLRFNPPNYDETLMESTTFTVFRKKLGYNLDIDYALEKRDACNLNKRRRRSNDTAIDMKSICVPTKLKGCLFNITADPEELEDLWDQYPKIVLYMSLRLRLLWPEMIPRRQPSFDPRADPVNHYFIWQSWLEDDEPPLPIAKAVQYPLAFSTEELRYYLVLNLKAFEDSMKAYLNSITDTFTNSVGFLFQ